jgi:hypothetical protein
MGKSVDFFDGAESSTNPDFSGLNTSGLVEYANDAAYEADNAGSPIGGNSYYNTTLNQIRYYDEGTSSWTSVVDEQQKGAANGIAPLNGSSKIDATYLPSYVDDVEEYANLASFPVSGETGKIYVALDTERTYRWTGSIYTEISPNSITSVNGQTGVVVLNLNDINDVTEVSTAAREFLRRNSGNTAWENFNIDSTANDAATGANQTLTSISTSIVRLTNASLASVDMIPAGFSGQKAILVNATGTLVVISNDLGGTPANRILTGTAEDLELDADASLWLTYDSTTARWRVVGGSGAGGITWATPVDSDIVPDSDNTRKIGDSSGNHFLEVNTRSVYSNTDLGVAAAGKIQVVPKTNIELKDDGSDVTAVTVKMFDNQNGNYNAFKSPDALAGNTTYTTPSADGTNGQVLSTNGLGQMSWVNKDATYTASRALVSDGLGNATAATTTATEISYVNGVTSAIQTQLNGKEPTITVLGETRGGTNQSTYTKGDILVASGVNTLSKESVGTNGTFLKADSTDSNGVVWASVISTSATRSVTTTDTATTADDILLLSGASFTQTLFTAVGNTGKRITLFHNGTSLTQVYTLNTTGGQTIGGIASGSYALYTNGEKLELISDGANWLILDHKTDTGWVDFPSVAAGTLITAVTTSPTYGTIAQNYARWKRDGDDVIVEWFYRQTTAGTAGSGMYIFNLPTGITVHTTSHPTNAATTNVGTFSDAIVGQMNAQISTTIEVWFDAVVYTTSQLKFRYGGVANAAGSGVGIWNSTGQDFATNANMTFSLKARFKHANWNV